MKTEPRMRFSGRRREHEKRSDMNIVVVIAGVIQAGQIESAFQGEQREVGVEPEIPFPGLCGSTGKSKAREL